MGYYRDLLVWQRAHRLAVAIYRTTAGFPAAERFGLTSQIRRAAVSVSANIAEGSGRKSDAELARFVAISLGSLHELEAELLLARELGWLDAEVLAALEVDTNAIGRSLAALRRQLRMPKAPTTNNQ